ncbi:MAG: thioesterase family protein [Calditrichia bacterium]
MEVFTAKLKVRTYECDYYGHVNNATYLNYLEYARMEALYDKGFTLQAMKQKGYGVVVRRIDIEYKHPLYMGDEVTIRTFASESRNSSGTFIQRLFKDKEERLVAEARVTWVFTDLKGKPTAIPEEIKEAFAI